MIIIKVFDIHASTLKLKTKEKCKTNAKKIPRLKFWKKNYDDKIKLQKRLKMNTINFKISFMAYSCALLY